MSNFIDNLNKQSDKKYKKLACDWVFVALIVSNIVGYSLIFVLLLKHFVVDN